MITSLAGKDSELESEMEKYRIDYSWLYIHTGTQYRIQYQTSPSRLISLWSSSRRYSSDRCGNTHQSQPVSPVDNRVAPVRLRVSGRKTDCCLCLWNKHSRGNLLLTPRTPGGSGQEEWPLNHSSEMLLVQADG